MSETSAPTLLRVLVTRRHWQVYETFRHQYERAAESIAQREGDRRLRGLSVSKRQFERWYGGELKTRPYPDQCRVLEAMFGRPVDELLAPAPAAPPGAASGFDSASARQWERTGGRRLGDTTDGQAWGVPGPGDRERQVAMAARRAFRFGTAADGSTVGPETLAQLHDEIGGLADAYPRVPLTSLLGDLVDVQDTAFRILEDGRVRPAQAQELYLLAGIASGMLAKASHDLGDPRSAMTQARTAYVCAENAEHPSLRAWVRGLQSLITYWAGRPQDAAHYAALGEAHTEGLHGTATVWLASLAARAHAMLGDADAARDAIRRADTSRETVRPDDLDAYGGLLTFPRPRQLYYAAEAVVYLGDNAEAAQAHAGAAVEAYRTAPREDWAFGDEAGARTNLAIARVAGGELEGAAEAVRPVLELPFEQRNFGIVVSARRVHEALCDTRFRTARAAIDVREQIEEFSATSTAAVLR
jgi:tetratricopeptide (TPR) repeat protein